MSHPVLTSNRTAVITGGASGIGLATAERLVTGMMKRFLKEKPPSAWLPEQVADHLLVAIDRGDFYALCPDNEVTPEIDRRRIEWAASDMTMNRPALSRWNPDFEVRFAAFMAEERD